MKLRIRRSPTVSALALLVSSAAAADGSSAPAPKPPEQPAAGPGGRASEHATVRKLGPFGESGLAYWLYEPGAPAPANAPIIVFLHGYTGINASVYGGWIEHLVRRGNIVVFPRYQAGLAAPETYAGNALDAVKDAFRRLRDEPDHVRPDPEGRWAIVGHSLGCPIGADLAAAAEREGLPRPRALMICNAGDANAALPMIPPILQAPEKIPNLLLLVVAGADDRFVTQATGRRIFEQSTGVVAANKNFVTIESDRTGAPALVADHFAPLSMDAAYDNGATFASGGDESRRAALRTRIETLANPPGNSSGPGFGRADALDFYGYWKWLDGLTDAAFYGRNRQYALGDAAEQKFMGKWSDGAPVRPAVIEVGK